MAPKPNKFKQFLIDFAEKKVENWKKEIAGKEPVVPNFYDDLTPVDDVEKSLPYTNALAWALENHKIKNIAISGPYGSGKSSIIKTFEKKYPGYNYLNISLASFQDNAPEKAKPTTVADGVEGTATPTAFKAVAIPDDMAEKHRLIELSILQQMFYRVKAETIPDSRFSRIKSLSENKVLYNICLCLMCMLSISIFFAPKFFERFSWWPAINAANGDWILYLGIVLFVPGFYELAKYILRLINTSKFNKINLTKGEIEFDPKSETSILNKHLDEILYLFEVTPYNVVVIEDLDRFNDPEIFTKLRELNILINKAQQVGRHIVFLYAIKDDMFKDKSRTKFFDFIIPIIPVINWSNSYEIMLQKINQEGLDLKISDNLLSNLTLYIDDMRALKNIFNEFLIYKESLKDIKIKDDQLLAMIVYKNIYPGDFALLHDQNGIIYNVFRANQKIGTEAGKLKDAEIKKLKKQIETIQRIKPTNVVELRSPYIVEMLTKMPNASGIVVDGAQRTFGEIRDNDEYFYWLAEQPDISYYTFNPAYNRTQVVNSNVSFESIENKVDAELGYLERENLLDQAGKNEIVRLNSEIAKLNNPITDLKNQKISELLIAEPSTLILFEKAFTDKKLLVYLIRNGFINENYTNLISYFYAGSLSTNDKTFALGIADREAQIFEFELNNFSNLLERLTLDNFKEETILNFSLIDFLLQHPKKYQEYLDNIITLFIAENDTAISFLHAYINREGDNSAFIKILFKGWVGLWKYLIENSAYSGDEIWKYLELTVLLADDTDFINLNIDGVITNYVGATPEFLLLFANSDTEKVKNFIKKLKIKFIDLQEPEKSEELYSYVYEYQHYVLNEAMIDMAIVLKGALGSLDIKYKWTANYTYLQQSGAPALIKYVDDKLPEYVQNILLKLPGNTLESEKTVIELLNNSKLADGDKEKIIKKQTVQITDLKSITNKGLWVPILQDNKLVVSWKNVLTYFEQTVKMDVDLIDYLDQEDIYETLAKINFTKGAGKLEKTYHDYSRESLLEGRMTDKAYEELLKSNPYHYDSLAIENLSEEKVTALLKRRVIRLKPVVFNLLKEHFEDQIPLLIEYNIADYLKYEDVYELDETAYQYLLDSSKITLGQKTDIVTEITDEMVEADHDLASSVSRVIVDSDFNELSVDFVRHLVKNTSYADDKLVLLNRYMKNFTPAAAEELLNAIGGIYQTLVPRGKFPKLPISAINGSILNGLKNIGFIRKIKEDKNYFKVTNRAK
jgi:hypothetical protein